MRAGIKLFGELKGRVSPEDSNKKFVEIIYIPGMLQVFARLRCKPVRAGRRLRLDDKWSFSLWLQLTPRLYSGCADKHEVPFVKFSWDDCVVAPGLRLGLVFVEGLQGEDMVSVDEIFGG